MQAPKPSEEYETLKKKLKEKYQRKWYRLLPFGQIFIINLFTGRRALEGLTDLQKTDFEKKFDEDTNSYAYEEAVGGLSKNNRFSDQDLREGGCIPNEVQKSGKNLTLTQ